MKKIDIVVLALLFTALAYLLVLSFVKCWNYKDNKGKIPKDGNGYAVINGTRSIAMPEYYRRFTGMDTIQLVLGGRGKWNEEKQDFDVTWDSLHANFCYPNKWEFEKYKIDSFSIRTNKMLMDSIISYREARENAIDFAKSKRK